MFTVSSSKVRQKKYNWRAYFFSVSDWAAGLNINERIYVFSVDQYPRTRQSNKRIYAAISDGDVHTNTRKHSTGAARHTGQLRQELSSKTKQNQTFEEMINTCSEFDDALIVTVHKFLKKIAEQLIQI